MLEPGEDAPFLSDVARFVSHVAPLGAWNALARLVLHLTSPGTPDIYQGDEFWNFALVDPDNRRHVDYDARAAALARYRRRSLRCGEDSAAIDLYANRLKLLVTQRLLDFRRSHADVFTRGAYRPLAARGRRAGHVVAFGRSFEGQTCITDRRATHGGQARGYGGRVVGRYFGRCSRRALIRRAGGR